MEQRSRGFSIGRLAWELGIHPNTLSRYLNESKNIGFEGPEFPL